MTERHPGRQRKETWSICKAANCAREARAGKGFCHAHYMAARRGRLDWETGAELRPMLRVASYGPEARCSVPDCGRRPKANGMCTMHFQRVNSHPELGSGKTLERGRKPIYGEISECLVSGCAQRPVNRWMCQKHSQQRAAGIIDERGDQLRALLPTGRRRLRERWVGSTRDGYVLRVAPEDHPHPRVDGSILEHRLVMEQMLNRYLEDWEIVHHKDGNRQNNAPDNLTVHDGRARNGEGHHPGHDYDPATAIQILLQADSLPSELRFPLLQWRTRLRQDA